MLAKRKRNLRTKFGKFGIGSKNDRKPNLSGTIRNAKRNQGKRGKFKFGKWRAKATNRRIMPRRNVS